MSDFDKEAERRRLREKYENDRKKRQSTQRMSELLLKGATMTNTHCDTCGDPLFRYDGQEFCPTCNAASNEGDADAEAEAGAETGSDAEAQTVEPDAGAAANGDVTADADVGDVAAPTGGSADANAPQTTESVQPSGPAADRRSGAPRDEAVAADPQAASPSSEGRPVGDANADADANAGDASLTAARESLVRTLTEFSRRAEAADDPRRAREFLAAAREAAETLAALER